jgi:hypothetical protein
MENKPIKLPDTSKIKEFAATFQFENDPKVIFKKAAQKLAEDMSYTELRKISLASGVGSQFSIVDTVSEQYAPLVVSFARQLIEEYGCKKPSEIATAEIVAISHVQFLENSKLSKIYKRDFHLHKEMDRSCRRYLSSLAMLRQMKRPPTLVNIVTAQNAFIGQNQLNAVDKE